MLLSNNIKSIPAHQNIYQSVKLSIRIRCSLKDFIIRAEPTIILFPKFKLIIIDPLKIKTYNAEFDIKSITRK